MTITFGRSFGILSTKEFIWMVNLQHWEFEKFWGKNAKPETIERLCITKYETTKMMLLRERLNEKPDPKALERYSRNYVDRQFSVGRLEKLAHKTSQDLHFMPYNTLIHTKT
jgi:hypothetical protein